MVRATQTANHAALPGGLREHSSAYRQPDNRAVRCSDTPCGWRSPLRRPRRVYRSSRKRANGLAADARPHARRVASCRYHHADTRGYGERCVNVHAIAISARRSRATGKSGVAQFESAPCCSAGRAIRVHFANVTAGARPRCDARTNTFAHQWKRRGSSIDRIGCHPNRKNRCPDLFDRESTRRSFCRNAHAGGHWARWRTYCRRDTHFGGIGAAR